MIRLNMRVREVAERSEGMAHVGGPPRLTPGTYVSIVRRPVRHDIPSHLHSYAPLLSSIHTGIEPKENGVRFRYSHGTLRLWIGRRSVDLKKALGLSALRPTVGFPADASQEARVALDFHGTPRRSLS